jgi:hypothetical protein
MKMRPTQLIINKPIQKNRTISIKPIQRYVSDILNVVTRFSNSAFHDLFYRKIMMILKAVSMKERIV